LEGTWAFLVLQFNLMMGDSHARVTQFFPFSFVELSENWHRCVSEVVSGDKPMQKQDYYDELAVIQYHITFEAVRRPQHEKNMKRLYDGNGEWLFLGLPSEVWGIIVDYINFRDYLSFAEVNKFTWDLVKHRFKQTLRNTKFRQDFFRSDYQVGVPIQEFATKRKELVNENYGIEKAMQDYIQKAESYEGKLVEYGAKSGDIFTFDISKKAVGVFSLKTGDRVMTKKGPAVTIGVRDSHLWFHIKGDRGASYWPDPTDLAGLAAIGITPIVDANNVVESVDLWEILTCEMSDPDVNPLAVYNRFGVAMFE